MAAVGCRMGKVQKRSSGVDYRALGRAASAVLKDATKDERVASWPDAEAIMRGFKLDADTIGMVDEMRREALRMAEPSPSHPAKCEPAASFAKGNRRTRMQHYAAMLFTALLEKGSSPILSVLAAQFGVGTKKLGGLTGFYGRMFRERVRPSRPPVIARHGVLAAADKLAALMPVPEVVARQAMQMAEAAFGEEGVRSALRNCLPANGGAALLVLAVQAMGAGPRTMWRYIEASQGGVALYQVGDVCASAIGTSSVLTVRTHFDNAKVAALCGAAPAAIEAMASERVSKLQAAHNTIKFRSPEPDLAVWAVAATVFPVPWVRGIVLDAVAALESDAVDVLGASVPMGQVARHASGAVLAGVAFALGPDAALRLEHAVCAAAGCKPDGRAAAAAAVASAAAGPGRARLDVWSHAFQSWAFARRGARMAASDMAGLMISDIDLAEHAAKALSDGTSPAPGGGGAGGGGAEAVRWLAECCSDLAWLYASACEQGAEVAGRVMQQPTGRAVTADG